MKKLLPLLLFFYFNYSANAQKNSPPPKDYTSIGQAIGDLDKDGIAEKVIVFDTNQEEEKHTGTVREIHIFKKKGNNWVLWHLSKGAVMPSKTGGQWGDPFSQITIQRGCIVLQHTGGGHYKWSHIHRFRYQNDTWELIGATTEYGSVCVFWEKFDYNLSTGKIHYGKWTNECTPNPNNTKIEKRTFLKKLKVLPQMDSFSPANNEMKFPNFDGVFYY